MIKYSGVFVKIKKSSGINFLNKCLKNSVSYQQNMPAKYFTTKPFWFSFLVNCTVFTFKGNWIIVYLICSWWCYVWLSLKKTPFDEIQKVWRSDSVYSIRLSLVPYTRYREKWLPLKYYLFYPRYRVVTPSIRPSFVPYTVGMEKWLPWDPTTCLAMQLGLELAFRQDFLQLNGFF